LAAGDLDAFHVRFSAKSYPVKVTISSGERAAGMKNSFIALLLNFYFVYFLPPVIDVNRLARL
jgi:hypothetical protein